MAFLVARATGIATEKATRVFRFMTRAFHVLVVPGKVRET